LEIQDGKVRLAQGKKSICAEVGIILDWISRSNNDLICQTSAVFVYFKRT
jgi:hypothetical protein